MNSILGIKILLTSAAILLVAQFFFNILYDYQDDFENPLYFLILMIITMIVIALSIIAILAGVIIAIWL